MRALIALGFLICLTAGPAGATARDVPADADRPGALARAIATAGAGDLLRLAPGLHRGPILILAPLTLDGGGRARIEGDGTGSVITVNAPDVTVRGLEIAGSGSSNETLDAAVRLTKKATRASVTDNSLFGNLVGVDVHGARDAFVAGNRIEGRRDHRMNDRGNGIYVWNAPGARIIGNDVRWGRDGIFVNTSSRNSFTGNRFRDLRFAIHYMYANDSEVSDNLSEGNHLGFALMFSKGLTIVGNQSIGDRDHGLLLNYANDARIEGNLIRGGAEKCVFLYNAHRNSLSGNRFEGCAIGIHFTAGSERNTISGNAFIGNRHQVKYVGSRRVDWSAAGRGNYWSDHAAYDLDGDGIADTAYRPNDLMDHILWSQPAAKLLLGAPAVQLIRWSQAAFPALLPGGVTDSRPLMRPVTIPTRLWSRQ
ncbi:nitrous oxide reductase family maturation protein NosD [Oceanibacterium hippocampi]|uniref:Periplasmic copper-binding protein (NosD) n=1 Tax=Oceanibacterium hippocampi TaxID=745714 RepID=A0A1Y5TD35_9PROT|nr:nitrous oxide reductase family maturation protein NosD [Oceanibacterium hippocampi]SLN61013.1 Periplasmic copper-binding protein (NosD) [Oceanibacterium hippocampi]